MRLRIDRFEYRPGDLSKTPVASPIESRVKAYEQGAEARRDGEPETANPFQEGTDERRMWARGWASGE